MPTPTGAESGPQAAANDREVAYMPPVPKHPMDPFTTTARGDMTENEANELLVHLFRGPRPTFLDDGKIIAQDIIQLRRTFLRHNIAISSNIRADMQCYVYRLAHLRIKLGETVNYCPAELISEVMASRKVVEGYFDGRYYLGDFKLYTCVQESDKALSFAQAYDEIDKRLEMDDDLWIEGRVLLNNMAERAVKDKAESFDVRHVDDFLHQPSEQARILLQNLKNRSTSKRCRCFDVKPESKLKEGKEGEPARKRARTTR